jgi:ATP-dependent helicase/DNAse subunit B
MNENRLLLLGPAGCGKSQALRQCFLDALQAGDGAGVLLLVPTASYREHTRNEVLRQSRIGAIAGEPICTFRDLLGRLAPGAAAPLTAVRRDLLARRLLRDMALEEFAPVADFAGFRASLLEAADELRANGLTPNALRGALQRFPAGRHRAFLRFLEAYSAALASAGIDERRQLGPALEAIRAGALPLRLLLVDGFSDFTPEQRELLAALLGAAPPAVRIALTLDQKNTDFFYQAARSRAWLQSFGFDEIWLGNNYRAEVEPLAAVEQLLRGADLPEFQVPSPKSQVGAAEDLGPGTRDPGLGVFAAADRRDEAELIGREVLRLVRSGVPYRDIGIIVNQASEYGELLRGVFRRLDIPVRSYLPTTLAASAYGRHLRLCLDLLRPDNRPESIFAWLKSPYCTVRSRYVAERFEYRAVERMAEARKGRWEKITDGQPVMAGVVASLERLDRELSRASTVRAFAEVAASAWKELTRLPSVPDGVDAARALELRAEARAIGQANGLLEQVVEAAEAEGDPAGSFAGFCELLLVAMAAEPLGVRDRRQDAVNLMGTYEARQWELPVVFVAGLIEKEFPAARSDPPFLDDQERQAIAEWQGVRLPTAADRLRDQHLLFYVAATRARRWLYFTYPQSDAAGKPLLRSFFLRGLDRLLTAPTCRVLKRSRADIVPPPELAANASDLLALAHRGLAQRVPPPAEPNSPERRAEMQAMALYELLLADSAIQASRHNTRLSAQALARRPSHLRDEVLAVLQAQKEAGHFSVTALETFAGCQFHHFVRYLLKLQGPAEAKEIDALREGEIAHQTIEQWTRGGCREPIEQVLDRCFAEATAEIPTTHVAKKSHADLQGALRWFARFESERAKVYRTAVDPARIELRFGSEKAKGDASATPPLEFTLDDGSSTVVTVGGRLDRVETAPAAALPASRALGLVVDFKCSSAGFARKRESIEAGEELQLPIYLMAVGELFGLAPAGAELHALKTDKHPRCGIYDASLASSLFVEGPPAGGVPLPEEEFRHLIDQARDTVKRLAAEIRRGAIEVSGDDWKRCQNCDFPALCRITRAEVERRARERELEVAAR